MSHDDYLVQQRIAAVLETGNCAERLYKLLLQLKEEGFPRAKMLKMLTNLEVRHRIDLDDAVYDAILLGIDVVFSSTHPRRIF